MRTTSQVGHTLPCPEGSLEAFHAFSTLSTRHILSPTSTTSYIGNLPGCPEGCSWKCRQPRARGSHVPQQQEAWLELPSRTHLARDASDERHFPGLAHLSVPGAASAGAAYRRVCHVATGLWPRAGRSGGQWSRDSGAEGTWGCACTQASSPKLQGSSAPRGPPPQSDRGALEAGRGGPGAGRGGPHCGAAGLRPGGRRVIRVRPRRSRGARGRPRPPPSAASLCHASSAAGRAARAGRLRGGLAAGLCRLRPWQLHRFRKGNVARSLGQASTLAKRAQAVGGLVFTGLSFLEPLSPALSFSGRPGNANII